MKSLKMAVLPMIIALMFFTTGCTRIAPGHVGIVVNAYGSDKGVQSYPVVTGQQWFNPITTSILEYPTFMQTAVWTKSHSEGNPVNEEMTFTSSEGVLVTGDISLSYQLMAEQIPGFYVKFRNDDLKGFTHGFLRNVARDSFNEESVKFTTEELNSSKKEVFLNGVKDRMNAKVTPYGVKIEQFGFVGALRLPDNVVAAFNAKIQATQQAIMVENQLRSAEAEAKKRIAAAEGEAKSNEILTRSLSPQLLQWRTLELREHAIAKWNGVPPKYIGGKATAPFMFTEDESK